MVRTDHLSGQWAGQFFCPPQRRAERHTASLRKEGRCHPMEPFAILWLAFGRIKIVVATCYCLALSTEHRFTTVHDPTTSLVGLRSLSAKSANFLRDRKVDCFRKQYRSQRSCLDTRNFRVRGLSTHEVDLHACLLHSRHI